MVWSTIAGAGDWAAGSVDESIGRQFDSQPGGGFADLGETGESNEDGLALGGEDAAYYNRYLQGDGVRTLYDSVVEYQGTLNGSEDTADFLGPTAGATADAAVDVEGEETSAEERKAQLWIYGGAALVVLYLSEPLLEIVAGVIE